MDNYEPKNWDKIPVSAPPKEGYALDAVAKQLQDILTRGLLPKELNKEQDVNRLRTTKPC